MATRDIHRVAIAMALGYMCSRRILDLKHFREIPSSTATDRDASGQDERLPLMIVLLPVYREESMVAGLVEHFASLAYPSERLRCVLITTAKESSTATFDAAQDAVRRFPSVAHLHYPSAHAYRAAQLNYALSEVAGDADPADTYVAVYNADSRPDTHTLRAVAREALALASDGGELPPVLQQLCHYMVPARYARQRSALAAAAALQTFWHATRHRSQLRRYTARGAFRVWLGMPATTTGHGEFFLLSALHLIGGFPAYAYADGLLVGWEMLFKEQPLRVTTVAFDHAEVPPSLRELIRQHAAWCTGLANVSAARRQNSERAGLAALFLIAQWITMAVWALRLPAYVLLALAAGAAGAGYGFVSAVVIALHAGTPVLAVMRHPSLRPVPSSGSRATGSALMWSPLVVAVDGMGFWIMLSRRLRRSAFAVAPEKTAR
jgi:cellulose synthase/poly-beta-1,6-N-acetylglucosamine synthase-like glycosyltransferase